MAISGPARKLLGVGTGYIYMASEVFRKYI